MLHIVSATQGPQRPQRPTFRSTPVSAAAREHMLTEIARLREAIFALTDVTPGLHDRDLAEVPVRLQAAAYELGQAERMLDPAPLLPASLARPLFAAPATAGPDPRR